MTLRSHTSKTTAPDSAPPVQNPLRSRPFAPQAPPIADTPEQPATPDLQTQLETARRLGHSFSKISASKPALIQPKLTIGAPGDQYEQEADRVAQQVMNMADAATPQSVQREGMSDEDELKTKPLAPTITPLMQRETLPDEDELQMKPLADQIQRQVELPEEDELQMKSVLQRETDPEEEEELQMKPLADQIQRELDDTDLEAWWDRPDEWEQLDPNEEELGQLQAYRAKKLKEAGLAEEAKAVKNRYAEALDTRVRGMRCVSWEYFGETYHINLYLGTTHVTKEQTNEHYYFSGNGADIEDRQAGKEDKSTKGTQRMFSALHPEIQGFIKTHYWDLLL